jgi:hypothetical protein
MSVEHSVLAQLAGSAYGNVTERNKVLAPIGWTQIATYPSSGPSDDPITGFSAVAYRGPGGAIVIAYAGTNVESKLDNDWLQANVPAALGAYSPQVLQAAQFAGGQYEASRGGGEGCNNGSANHRLGDFLAHRAAAAAGAALLLRRTA